MLENTQIANVALALNFLPSITRIGAVPTLTKPSKSETLIANLWESDYFKTAGYIDWSHLIRLIKPVAKPCEFDIGYDYCYGLEAPFVIDKVIGFNDMSHQIPFKKYGMDIYASENIDVVHCRMLASPYSFEVRTIAFEALLTAYLAYSVGVGVKSKYIEALWQSVALAQLGAKRAESNNHSSVRPIEMAYLRGGIRGGICQFQ